MASNDVEVLDPATTIKKLSKFASERVLNRRHFMAALGLAGTAVGTDLISGTTAHAQQPTSPGYAQVDVLNFLLNVKYLKATLYSFVTQGVDLPGSSFVTVGTGVVYNQPGKITFSTQQLTDMVNEMYYDELNQLITLRSLQGVAVASRGTINLLGTGGTTTATTTLTQSQFLALARLLEDLSVQAFAGALIYLTGTNLEFASQALATDGFHAGAVRLACIQNNVQYQSALTFDSATTATDSLVTISASTTTGSPIIYATAFATPPIVGQILTGIGVPPGAGAVITAVNSVANAAITGIPTKGSNIINTVSSVAGLLPGMIITGTNIPAGAIVTGTASSPNTITFGLPSGTATSAAATTTVAPTGIVTSGSNQVTVVSSSSGVLVGQPITGTSIPTGTTVTAVSGTSTGGPNGISNITITMSANATASSTVKPTGMTTNGSNVISAVSSTSGLVLGLTITGTGIPAGTTITATNTTPTNSITLSANATVTSTSAVTFTSPTTETVTIPTTGAIVVGLSSLTIAGNATVTGLPTLFITVPDSFDVVPGDNGASSASGPQTVAGTSPAMYQGFFDTAGAATSSANNPAGFAFARTFQQVLTSLLNYNSSTTLDTTQNYEGGFFPFGVTGTINSVT
jgi:hypothetical protein